MSWWPKRFTPQAPWSLQGAIEIGA